MFQFVLFPACSPQPGEGGRTTQGAGAVRSQNRAGPAESPRPTLYIHFRHLIPVTAGRQDKTHNAGCLVTSSADWVRARKLDPPSAWQEARLLDWLPEKSTSSAQLLVNAATVSVLRQLAASAAGALAFTTQGHNKQTVLQGTVYHLRHVNI